MSLLESQSLENDPKRARIIEGAMKTFLAYGFERTTMDDIAKAAEVSRPALYLVFRNKADIYRAIGSVLLGRSLEQARAALASKGSFVTRTMNAFEAAMFSMVETIEQSPHGAEILDMKNALAAELIEPWRNGLVNLLAQAIEDEAGARSAKAGKDLPSAQVLAELVCDALEGAKARGASIADKRVIARAMISLVENSLKG